VASMHDADAVPAASPSRQVSRGTMAWAVRRRDNCTAAEAKTRLPRDAERPMAVFGGKHANLFDDGGGRAWANEGGCRGARRGGLFFWRPRGTPRSGWLGFGAAVVCLDSSFFDLFNCHCSHDHEVAQNADATGGAARPSPTSEASRGDAEPRCGTALRYPEHTERRAEFGRGRRRVARFCVQDHVARISLVKASPAQDPSRRGLDHRSTGCRPMNEATTSIPWLQTSEALTRVAHHRGCTPEAAQLLIVGAGKANRLKARGVIKGRSVSLRIVGAGKGGRAKARGAIEDQPVSPLPAAWNGTINFVAATMKPPDVSYEIADLKLCFIDLVAADLLPAPAEKTWWPTPEAYAYLAKGVPLPWKAWQGEGTSAAEIEQAEIDLSELILAGVVPAQGRLGPFAPMQRIPPDNLHPDMIEHKALPIAHPPKVVVDCQGSITTSPRQRSADYRGPRWQAIEVDSAALRQARPRSAEPEPAPPTGPTPLSPKLSAQEPPPGEVEQQRQLLLLSDEPQLEGPRQWRPDEALTWFKNAKQDHPQKSGESKNAYARRLYEHMKNDFGENIPWTEWTTLRRRLNDPPTKNS